MKQIFIAIIQFEVCYEMNIHDVQNKKNFCAKNQLHQSSKNGKKALAYQISRNIKLPLNTN